MKRFTLALMVAALLVSGQAQSATITASDSGWYDSGGNHVSTNKNYYTSSFYHNYFVFDLSGVSGAINSASLSLWDPYSGTAASGTYNSHAVSTSISDLESTHSNATNIYSDLGSGTVLGTVHMDMSSDGHYVTVNLNSDGLAYVQSHEGGSVAFGGTWAGSDYTFAFSGDPSLNSLTVNTSAAATPEPASLTLLGLGGFGLAGYGWRRRRQAVTA